MTFQHFVPYNVPGAPSHIASDDGMTKLIDTQFRLLREEFV